MQKDSKFYWCKLGWTQLGPVIILYNDDKLMSTSTLSNNTLWPLLIHQ